MLSGEKAAKQQGDSFILVPLFVSGLVVNVRSTIKDAVRASNLVACL